jgi:hypothetical protein
MKELLKKLANLCENNQTVLWSKLIENKTLALRRDHERKNDRRGRKIRIGCGERI